jgi:hypothetical protein
VSFPLIILLAWLSIALAVIVVGFVVTSNKEPARYLTLNPVREEPSADGVNEVQRKAA